MNVKEGSGTGKTSWRRWNNVVEWTQGKKDFDLSAPFAHSHCFSELTVDPISLLDFTAMAGLSLILLCFILCYLNFNLMFQVCIYFPWVEIYLMLLYNKWWLFDYLFIFEPIKNFSIVYLDHGIREIRESGTVNCNVSLFSALAGSSLGKCVLLGTFIVCCMLYYCWMMFWVDKCSNEDLRPLPEPRKHEFVS